MVGRTFEALVEGPSKKDAGMLTGRTRGNQIVHFPGGADLAGELVPVRIDGFSPLSLRGRIVG
jgi:tRNA-2-methylthio-N6-dimethylallyladenosine synthase